ncbi:hypothetical protein ANO14919_059820 [Xylariales sp. No.14919]|nr:hypothetical protein ANO14919_059820 [Xylariales sp. No.14919]
MKVSSTVSSLFVAATATTALADCPILWDDPRGIYGNPGYRKWDPYFDGTGKVHLRVGCTYWRQNYPRVLPDEPLVGCMNEDGLVVPIGDDNCATFNFFRATGQIEDHRVEMLRTAKNNYICGANFVGPDGEWGEDGRWTCKTEGNGRGGDVIDTFDGDAPLFLAEYVGGTISTELFTWWIQHPPASTADTQALQYRLPDNPWENYTLKSGDGTFPILIEFVRESYLE